MRIVKIVTVGSRVFVTSSQLAGIQGIIAETPNAALDEIKKLTEDSDVGLILVSDDISNPINDQLTELRAEKSTLVFSLPAPGSEKVEVDYRVMLKKILGV
jgi:V/A-type H+/Na+-transporting ATPase subunit F